VNRSPRSARSAAASPSGSVIITDSAHSRAAVSSGHVVQNSRSQRRKADPQDISTQTWMNLLWQSIPTPYGFTSSSSIFRGTFCEQTGNQQFGRHCGPRRGVHCVILCILHAKKGRVTPWGKMAFLQRGRLTRPACEALASAKDHLGCSLDHERYQVVPLQFNHIDRN